MHNQLNEWRERFATTKISPPHMNTVLTETFEVYKLDV